MGGWCGPQLPRRTGRGPTCGGPRPARHRAHSPQPQTPTCPIPPARSRVSAWVWPAWVSARLGLARLVWPAWPVRARLSPTWLLPGPAASRSRPGPASARPAPPRPGPAWSCLVPPGPARSRPGPAWSCPVPPGPAPPGPARLRRPGPALLINSRSLKSVLPRASRGRFQGSRVDQRPGGAVFKDVEFDQGSGSAVSTTLSRSIGREGGLKPSGNTRHSAGSRAGLARPGRASPNPPRSCPRNAAARLVSRSAAHVAGVPLGRRRPRCALIR